MRTEFARFDKNLKALVVTSDRNDEKWCCMAYHKKFTDGIHQQEVWFRPTEDKSTDKEWMLDDGDQFELDCLYDKNGWNWGFYYGCNHKSPLVHSCICLAVGIGKERNIICRSFNVIK